MARSAKNKRPAQKASLPEAPYKLTAAELASVEALQERLRSRKPAPKLKDTPSGQVFDHPNPKVGKLLALESVGLASATAFEVLVEQIINVATRGNETDIPRTNGMLAMIQGIEPRDTVEAMLASQMVAVHNATMFFARRLNHVDSLPQQDSASNVFNKLTRTFAAQVEALNRYRGKGQQRVTVEHVTVNAGGQAIVGHVQGGGALRNAEDQPHAPNLTHDPSAPLRSNDESRTIVQQSSRTGEETVSNARRR